MHVTGGDVRKRSVRPADRDPQNYLESAEKLRIFRRGVNK